MNINHLVKTINAILSSSLIKSLTCKTYYESLL